jgi:hypothetical protein
MRVGSFSKKKVEMANLSKENVVKNEARGKRRF